MDQRRRYRKPPIEEAVCEFHFYPGTDWDRTIPERLRSELGDEYSGKSREQKAVQVELEFQDGERPNLQYGEGLARVQLVTRDEKRMIGVGPGVLNVHMLHPYRYPACPEPGGWDEFEPRISSALDAYWKVVEPVGVCRIGVRYINKIVIPGRAARVDDYLKCALSEVDGLPDRLAGFMSRVEYVYEDGIRLILSQGSVDPQPGSVSFLLDLDVIWEIGDPIDKIAAMERTRNLRNRERKAFEAVITDKSRELFDAG